MALGAVNLLAGLALGLGEIVPATRFVLEVVVANFGVVLVGAVAIGAAMLPAIRPGLALAARCTALTLVVCGCLVLAGMIGIAFQLWQGERPEMTLYASGLTMNLGWRLCHFIALLLSAQALLGRRTGAAAALLLAGAHFVFEQGSLRYGADAIPWSYVDGYGPFLYWHVAAGICWSALSVLLLAVAQIFASPRSAWRQRLTANVGTVAWAACVFGAVCGGWMYYNLHTGRQSFSVSETDGQRLDRPPQPEYSRLDFALDLFPVQRRLAVRGRAIVVNRRAAAIAELHLAFPPWLQIDEVALTGELVEQRSSYRRFRLNRPLASGETLRIEYTARWDAQPLPEPAKRIPLLANGTFLLSTDLVPTLAHGYSPTITFAPGAAVIFGTRVSTALDQIAVAPGVLERAWREEDRAYFEYQTAAEIPARASIHSGRYALWREELDSVIVEAYYPPRRPDMRQIIAAAKRQLEHLDNRAVNVPTPFRIVVVPDYRPLVQGLGLLAIGWQHPAEADAEFERLASTGVWPYSERRALQRIGKSGREERQ